MGIKELKTMIAELQRQLAELEREEAEVPYGDLKAGDTFIFKGHEYTKLRDGRAIINDYRGKNFENCPFDNVHNCYSDSIIHHYINNKYIEILELSDDDFVADKERCSLLSQSAYEVNRALINDFECAWWLGYGNCCGTSVQAIIIDECGDLGADVVWSLNGVRPAFNFAKDIKVQVVNEHKD